MKRSAIAFALAVAAPAAQAQTPLAHAVPVIDVQKAVIVHRLTAPSTVNTGRIEKQAVIASIPYAYNKPVTLTSDYKSVATGKTVAKGTQGFDAGFYKTNFRPVPVHVYCFFGDPAAFSGPDTFAKEPVCYIPEFTALFGKPLAGELQVRSYIPTSFSGNPMPVNVPEISEDGAPIDHDFHIDISFKRWFKNYQGELGIVVYFKSEGHIIDENFLAVDAEDVLRLDLGDGVLKLRIDPTDADHVYADFEKGATQP